MKKVELMVREGCGSCVRVAEQIRPVVEKHGASLSLVDVDASADPELAMEYGDRVPVVVIDGEEFACWEVDNEDLAAELS
ncbi:glutaredoxin family protein [Corynebacterium sp. UBA2622]|uniref:glutaredoxin family protein n=1 Tax=Corynebacterium sp. UBA2622 TaxID=1946393 RepID=UPI0025C16CA9|nr:glutaredoxin family protein [Corynebacterium sp. UBA2622]